VAAGVELYQDSVGVRYLDGVSDVAFADRRMLKAKKGEMGAPDLEVVVIADAKGYCSKAAERSSSPGLEM
jgi:hypothetical protein